MNTLLLEETSCTDDLLPFTATRSVLDIRMGILTFREKWARLLGSDSFRLEEGAGALPANILHPRPGRQDTGRMGPRPHHLRFDRPPDHPRPPDPLSLADLPAQRRGAGGRF